MAARTPQRLRPAAAFQTTSDRAEKLQFGGEAAPTLMFLVERSHQIASEVIRWSDNFHGSVSNKNCVFQRCS